MPARFSSSPGIPVTKRKCSFIGTCISFFNRENQVYSERSCLNTWLIQYPLLSTDESDVICRADVSRHLRRSRSCGSGVSKCSGRTFAERTVGNKSAQSRSRNVHDFPLPGEYGVDVEHSSHRGTRQRVRHGNDACRI